MLSKSAARGFFLLGTLACAGAFVLLTLDTIKRVPSQTHEENLTEQVVRGKNLWDKNNCMGCHTILGEGAYYAPELTKVYQRRGEVFMRSMLEDPEKMYPGQRKMQKYNLTAAEISDLIAFFKWIGEIDTNGFPTKPDLVPVALASSDQQGGAIAAGASRPKAFNQLCIACHSLQGQGGAVGPALDGVGDRRDQDYLAKWLRDPSQLKADAKMPKLPLSEQDIIELTAFLSQLKGASK